MTQLYTSSRLRAAPTTVAELHDAIAQDNDWLTLDEILNAPIHEVERELAEQGLDDFEIDIERLSATFNEPSLPISERLDSANCELHFPVDRPDSVGEFLAALRLNPAMILGGPAGCGKSTFVRREFLQDRDVRAEFRRAIVLDCAALRVASPVQFGREAVWAHYGLDDAGFKSFLEEMPDDCQGGNALSLLVERRLRDGGLLIFDQAEYLDRTGEIDQWLTRHLLPLAARLGVKVVFVERTPIRHSRSAFKDVPCWLLPDIDADDLDRWIAHRCPAKLKAEGLSARIVLWLTGGRPGLLRDLGMFLRYNPRFSGHAVLRAFRKWRLRDDQFFTDCERLVRIARIYPEVISHVMTPGGAPLARSDIDADVVDMLISTGAVRVGDGERLLYSSPFYARRIARLLEPDAMAMLAVRSDFQALHSTKAWKGLKRFGELASDALVKALGYERSPLAGLQRFCDVLSRWDFNAKVYVRDEDNARLWAPYSRPERVGPLENWKQPDFARAVQTGQTIRAEDGRIFHPIISNAGIAAMVIELDFVKKAPPLPCTRQVDADRIAGVLHGMRPTLAALVQQMAQSRERKFQGKLLFKPQLSDAQAGKHGLLREIGCQSIAVIERRRSGSWSVARFERTGSLDDMRWVEAVDGSRLEAIVSHPSRRGLVLSAPSLAAVFPRLGGRNAAVYLHPIYRSEGAAIVAFLFEGSDVAIDGKIQARLSVAAPGIAA